LDRRAKVELFERLRREHEFGIGTVKGGARQFGVHRRMVRQAVESALPPLRGYRPRAKPALEPVVAFIDAILEADTAAPRKQRHTARRIHQRILAELPGCAVAESTVRNHVRERRQVLGRDAHPTFVPQSYAWGSEAQVDWYEATAELGGDRVTLQVFCMRSMASGAAFHRAYPRATQQAFLEAHEHAFAYFGGVHRVLRYDNLTSAVRKVLRGHRREETVRFVAFRSHWRFEAQFCTPAAGHEKGGVEGEIGYFRRNHWVPVPSAADLDELNKVLLAGAAGPTSGGGSTVANRVSARLWRSSGIIFCRAPKQASIWPRCRSPWSARAAASRCTPTPTRYRCGLAARCRPAFTRPISRSGTTVSVSPVMSAVTAAGSRFSTSITISTCSSASRGRWPAPSRSSNGGRADGGRPSLTRCGGD